ncbi:MAG TPA: MBL fold metallo-hydrolase [Rhodocyclaceae bacterium]|nr:MBL fold metallo-hydrolase [Rhodocyclaceae bacterium]
MKYAVIPVTPFQQNCSILVDDATQRAVVVDPGGDVDRIVATLEKNGITVERILLTHGHLDHASAAGELAQRLGGVPIEGPHEDEKFLIDNLPVQCASYGFPVFDAFTPTRWLKDGDTVQFGNETLEVIHCPGHTPGHVVFFHRGRGLAIVGDVIFAGSVGRTDFDFKGKPYGDFDTLAHSIRQKLFPLGDDVEFIPGHGPNSTFGRERQTNPYVGEDA